MDVLLGCSRESQSSKKDISAPPPVVCLENCLNLSQEPWYLYRKQMLPLQQWGRWGSHTEPPANLYVTTGICF